MKTKTKRQAMSISISDLLKLKNELLNQEIELANELGEYYVDLNKKYSVSIINKEPKCSDTWELE